MHVTHSVSLIYRCNFAPAWGEIEQTRKRAAKLGVKPALLLGKLANIIKGNVCIEELTSGQSNLT